MAGRLEHPAVMVVLDHVAPPHVPPHLAVLGICVAGKTEGLEPHSCVFPLKASFSNSLSVVMKEGSFIGQEGKIPFWLRMYTDV